VIISNVYRPHITRTEEESLVHGSAPAMLRQTANIILSEKERRGIELIHRLHPNVTLLNVSADLGKFSFIDRGNARQLLTRGYREALKVLAAAKQRGTFDVRSSARSIGKA
jgi:NTE family protein